MEGVKAAGPVSPGALMLLFIQNRGSRRANATVPLGALLLRCASGCSTWRLPHPLAFATCYAVLHKMLKMEEGKGPALRGTVVDPNYSCCPTLAPAWRAVPTAFSPL